MEKKSGWADPESFSHVFRCTTVKYAESLLRKGEIKFSTPSSWVKYALKAGEGRGDKLEGTIATFNMRDDEGISETYKSHNKHPDLFPMNIGERVYLKKTRDMELPCFCFYILKMNMFTSPNEEGKHRISTTVPATYFQDFMDQLEPDEVEQLNPSDRPAVVFINDFEEFKLRIVNSLMELGLRREEIIFERIKYIDFNKYGKYGWWSFEGETPLQLALKHDRFKNQSEARIIINTDNESIKQILMNPIEIGSLEDIAQVSNTYFYEGLSVELNVDLKSID
ncbi:hypothetical protein [Sporosarcina sp. P17b]|uniref:hypothetical protein n=1 Tax=Sporosarcina sp. P17b TaxID=2048260 RepID=UPI000C165188|nr:hypothetical protein [Sporosarcina sp. P17b]PIC73325.1 hypothetical protein CSV76_10940 [Sporosarcina sp. P17b]